MYLHARCLFQNLLHAARNIILVETYWVQKKYQAFDVLKWGWMRSLSIVSVLQHSIYAIYAAVDRFSNKTKLYLEYFQCFTLPPDNLFHQETTIIWAKYPTLWTIILHGIVGLPLPWSVSLFVLFSDINKSGPDLLKH